ncbi:hypothetical protein HDU76_014069 [Blyttiomyces sp. JEL0837]|nr:hypothetical protein HDU76_014069 [Blyttiomyces sp. JEL0837]
MDGVAADKPRKSLKAFYSVRVGKVPGIYATWPECEDQVAKQKGAEFRSFHTIEEAADYMRQPSRKSGQTLHSEAQIQLMMLNVLDKKRASSGSADLEEPKAKRKDESTARPSEPQPQPQQQQQQQQQQWNSAQSDIQFVFGDNRNFVNGQTGSGPNNRNVFNPPQQQQQQVNGISIQQQSYPQQQQQQHSQYPYQPQQQQPFQGQIQNGHYQYPVGQQQPQAQQWQWQVPPQQQQQVQIQPQTPHGEVVVSAGGSASVSYNAQSVLVVYTDGSCLGNGTRCPRAGVGVYFGPGDRRNVSERLPGELQTNNRAEIMAAIRAIEVAPRDIPMRIMTDSAYLRQGLDTWLPNWKKRNWRTADGKVVMNQDLWSWLDQARSERPAPVEFKWCKAHSGIFGNEEADRLANEGAVLPPRD